MSCEGNCCSKSFVGICEIPKENGLNQFVEFFKTNTAFAQPDYFANVIPIDTVISDLCLEVKTIPSAGKKATATLCINGNITPLTIQLTDAGPKAVFNRTDKVIALAGDYVNFMYNVDNGASTDFIRISVILNM